MDTDKAALTDLSRKIIGCAFVVRRIEELRQQWLDAPDAAGGDAVRENGGCWARMMSRLGFVSDINRTGASFSVVYLCPFVFICGSIPM
jgi:hypothetical protein